MDAKEGGGEGLTCKITCSPSSSCCEGGDSSETTSCTNSTTTKDYNGEISEAWLRARENPKIYTKDPFKTWDRWYRDALRRGNKWAHNMVLCTCGEDMQPQVRNVTLHVWDEKGFVFCTNYDGPKSQELAENPYASVCFRWPELSRQVRITGSVSKVSPAETEWLFRRCRPIEQTNFYAFAHGKDHPYNQSNVCDNIDELANYTREVFAEYADKEVPLPKAWGGYRLDPFAIEFLDAGVPWNYRVLWQKKRLAEKKEEEKEEGKSGEEKPCEKEKKELESEDGYIWSWTDLVP